MEDFMQVILGGMSWGTVGGYVMLVVVGAVLSLMNDVRQRDVESQSTPNKFSWWFLIKDNFKRGVWVLALAYVVVRFSGMLFPGEPIAWVMVSLGYNIDNILSSYKKNSRLVGMDRIKFMR